MLVFGEACIWLKCTKCCTDGQFIHDHVVCVRSPVTDSDEEDSAESSTDDEATEDLSQETSTDDRWVIHSMSPSKFRGTNLHVKAFSWP